MLTPPKGAAVWPSRLLPPLYGIMGTFHLWQMRAIVLTCSVFRGYATAMGKVSSLTDDHSENPCTLRSSSSVEIMSSVSWSACSISAMACSMGYCQDFAHVVWTSGQVELTFFMSSNVAYLTVGIRSESRIATILSGVLALPLGILDIP